MRLLDKGYCTNNVRSAGSRGVLGSSNFSSSFVTHGPAQLGTVAASAKREALNLEACRDTSLNGVLGVECSNHSVPTIFCKGIKGLGS